MSKKVSAGKCRALRQFETACGRLPVSSWTAAFPPRASMTSPVVFRITAPIERRIIQKICNNKLHEHFLALPCPHRQYTNIMKTSDKGLGLSDTADRMRRLRIVFAGDDHGSITKFTRELGVGIARWSNVENGSPISIQLASMLVQRYPGLTLDWIYNEKYEGMPMSMVDTLRPPLEQPEKTRQTLN